jgi:hypothetical protein
MPHLVERVMIRSAAALAANLAHGGPLSVPRQGFAAKMVNSISQRALAVLWDSKGLQGLQTEKDPISKFFHRAGLF